MTAINLEKVSGGESVVSPAFYALTIWSSCTVADIFIGLVVYAARKKKMVVKEADVGNKMKDDNSDSFV